MKVETAIIALGRILQHAIQHYHPLHINPCEIPLFLRFASSQEPPNYNEIAIECDRIHINYARLKLRLHNWLLMLFSLYTLFTSQNFTNSSK